MAHSEICPVCCGSGRYLDKLCHGCGGKGWIEVSDDCYPYYPYPYPIYPPYTITWEYPKEDPYKYTCKIKTHITSI